MPQKNQLYQSLEYIHEGNTTPVVEIILQNPEIINMQSKKHFNKTLLMYTIDALKVTNYPIEQLNLSKLFYIIIQQKNLNLKITDDYNHNVFDIIFKHARNANEFNIAKNLFTMGENLLTLIKDEATLRKILNKKNSKLNLTQKQKNFIQYIFPNIQEELLFETEIEYLKKLQPRIINILSNIFQFKQKIMQCFKDPICKDNLIHNSIIESFLDIYKTNHMNEKLLLAKLEDYIIINKNMINQSINNNPQDLLLVNILEIIKKFKEYLNFLNKIAVYKLGNEYDKNKN